MPGSGGGHDGTSGEGAKFYSDFQLTDNATRFVAGSSEKSKAYLRTFDVSGRLFQLALSESGLLFSGYNGDYGSSGKTLWEGVTKSDIPNLHYIISSSLINDPAGTIKQYWDTMPDGYYFCEIRCGSAYIAIVQRIDDGQHGAVIVYGYTDNLPIYLKRINGAWR